MIKLKNFLLICAGFICIGIGTIGVIMPLVPTTPFLLLAALCFAKGSEQFHKWLTSQPLYKKHLEGFATTRSMTLKAKLAILLPVTAMMFVIGLLSGSLHMRIFIAVLLGIKYLYFIFAIKTAK
ncbi:MAG: YbaN family protein [Defluviitaleaceae bacterium]|nr:YbaN family protein [Defluviitaleaceae bacterium]